MKKTITRGGETLVLYGGYATWTDKRGRLHSKEVRVYGPLTWDPAYYGDGSSIVEAVEKKARVRQPQAECREVWRY